MLLNLFLKIFCIFFCIYAILLQQRYAPLAQLDRAFGYEPRGRGFKSLRAYHLTNKVVEKLLFS